MTTASATPMNAMPELREARFEDHSAIMAVESSQGLTPRPFEDWAGLWTRNPVYRRLNGKWPIGWVLVDSTGAISGCVGNIPSAFELDGKEYIAANGRAWAAMPEGRPFALLLMEEFFTQAGAQLFLNTTVNDQAANAFANFGSARVPVGEWEQAAYWITNYRGFARAAARVKGIAASPLLSIPAGVALYLKDAIHSKRLQSRLKASFYSNFDQHFDEFWHALRKKKSQVLLGVRDREALDWHFGPALAKRRLWIATVSGSSGIIAYALFQRKDHEASGLTRMRLVDFQAIEQKSDCLTATLQLAKNRCSDEGIHALEQVGCDLPTTRMVDAHAPYRRNLPAWPYYYMASGTLAARLSDPGVWEPSSFDGDSSL